MMESDKFKRVLSRLEYYYREEDKFHSYFAYFAKLLMKLTNSLEQSVKVEFERAAKEQNVKKI